MIQAHELRIGNIVFAANKKNVTEGEVFELTNGYAIIKHHSSGTPIKFLYEELEPIALTPEILEKCGFEKYIKYDDKPQWENSKMFGAVYLDNMGLFNVEDYESGDVLPDGLLKYVHQLQNLYFALTGTELGINFIE